MELVFPQTHTNIAISPKNIIKSPVLYQAYRQNPKNKKFVIKTECIDAALVHSIFNQNQEFSRSITFYVNYQNKDFLIELNKELKIKQLSLNIENYDIDEAFFNNKRYKTYKKIQKLLHFRFDNDEEKLFQHIDTLNEMLISNNLLSFRNRINILQRIVNLRNHKLFKNRISNKLNSEIQKFQEEIDKINRKKINGCFVYDSIIDILRFDDSDQLQQTINKTENFNYENLFDFNYDFTGLLPKKAKIIELAAFFNATNCFNYIIANYVRQKDLTKKENQKLFHNLSKFSFASGNSAVHGFCNQNKLFLKEFYIDYFDIAIAYQNNFLYVYLTETLEVTKISKNLSKIIGKSNNFGILKKLVLDFGINLHKAIFCALDKNNFELLDFLVSLRACDINEPLNIYICFI